MSSPLLEACATSRAPVGSRHVSMRVSWLVSGAQVWEVHPLHHTSTNRASGLVRKGGRGVLSLHKSTLAGDTLACKLGCPGTYLVPHDITRLLRGSAAALLVQPCPNTSWMQSRSWGGLCNACSWGCRLLDTGPPRHGVKYTARGGNRFFWQQQSFGSSSMEDRQLFIDHTYNCWRWRPSNRP